MTTEGDESYRAALDAHEVEDVQPAYRTLLRRLKMQGADVYERAVDRYRNHVQPLLESGEGDPLLGWIDYGVWLAERWQPGRVVAVDESGLAEPVEETPPLGPLLIHLPDDAKEPGWILAAPRSPSESQRVTAELLCR